MALIRGNNLNNLMNGTSGDDMFAGLGGNDTYNGGAGTDTAWFSGLLNGYNFSVANGKLVVRDVAPAVGGMDGTDTLAGIEKLQFSNAQLSVSANEFQVNTYTPLFQQNSTIAALADGGFVVSWASWGPDGDQLGIVAQRYDAIGAAVGLEFQVNTYATDYQIEPTITALEDGGFVVSWRSIQKVGIGYDIFAQRYDADGAKAGIEFQVNTYTDSTQEAPSITALAGGGFAVVWSSAGQDADTSSGVYAQLYGAEGLAVGTEFRVNTYTSDFQGLPTVTGLAGGGFVATWYSAGQDVPGVYGGIFAQRYDLNGAKVGVEFQVNTYTDNDQAYSSVAALEDGGFVVCWTSNVQDGDSDGIYAQRYDINGLAAGTEFRINTTTSGQQAYPSIAALAGGGFVVTWQSDPQGDGSSWDIYAQRYDANGVAADVEFRVNGTNLDTQDDPSIAALADGGFVVSWTSNNQDGEYNGIYAQRYDAAGNAMALKLTGTAAADSITLDPGQLLTVDGANGNDTVNGATSNDILLGGAGNDMLKGNDGSDHLDGGTGNDILDGGKGDDEYVVDSVTDTLTEAVGAGNDTVYSSVSRILAANFENLIFTGTGNLIGAGNAIGNYLEGNSGDNFLDGKAGADILSGGAGNDTYQVDNVGDFVDELPGGGADLVQSSVTYTLSDNIENLMLTGTFAIDGTGNTGVNNLQGNAAANVLDGGGGSDNLSGGAGNDALLGGAGLDLLTGGAGNDTLTGGADADRFEFNTAPAASNLDILTDFASVDDTIDLFKSIFSALGTSGQALAASEFRSGAGISAAGDANDHIIYNSTTGDLYYDKDGTGATAAIKIAVLISHPTIDANDFYVVG